MKKMSGKLFILALVLTSGFTTAMAQQAYVGERLYLGLYSEPGATTEPIKTMSSGTRVEIIGRQGDFVKLRLADGVEGWARGEFVTQEVPARALLQEMTAERDRLRRQLETLSKSTVTEEQLKTLQQQLARAEQKSAQLEEQLKKAQTAAGTESQQQTDQQQVIDTLKEQLVAAEQTIAELQVKPVESHSDGDDTRKVSMTAKILWLMLSMLASLGLGAIFGIRWLSARIRKRFNGLKVW
jgi:SH3 domain protein